MLATEQGGVPKWLRERSAKPRCSGSNPLAASSSCLESFKIPSPRPHLTKKYSGQSATENHFMPKQLLHGGQINAPHDQMRGGKGMPQVMEAKFSILAALHAFLKAS